MGEKAILRDTANRLTAEVKAEATKVEQERKKARETARRIQDDGERQQVLMQAVSLRCCYVRSSINHSVRLIRNLTRLNIRSLLLKTNYTKNGRNCVH